MIIRIPPPLFSIIIPVYNVSSYLKQCVNSVLSQTFEDYELLLINDGSTDDSGNICNYLASADSRIKTFHQNNTGLAGARNTGIKNAIGYYCIFLDSDDFWSCTNMLSELDAVIQSEPLDLICFSYTKMAKEKSHNFSIKNTDSLLDSYIYPQYLLSMVRLGVYTSSACMKVLKREIILSNLLYFEEKRLSEDIVWSAKVMLSAESIRYINKDFYTYRVREDSITQSVGTKHICDLFEILDQLISIFYSVKKDTILSTALSEYIAFQFCTLLVSIRLNTQDVKKNIKKASRYKWLLKFDGTSTVKIVSITNKLLGFNLMSKLLFYYFKLFIQ